MAAVDRPSFKTADIDEKAIRRENPEELVMVLAEAKENLRERNPKAYRKWWAIIDKRWEMTLHHDLHAVGYFFNHRFQYKDNVHDDGEVMRGTMNVITRLARTMNERLDAMAEPFELSSGVKHPKQVEMPRRINLRIKYGTEEFRHHKVYKTKCEE
ncbi:hypothetical protein Taro_014757 [Colocasia esculenta]|uniref:Uncharacterized protein n=1 Tax=Colocasia esculenta TaxID=4460 RepID=A0A843UFT8_COLES|nr:hypothetical protein [Colocasia esculenta]